ncbi:hypothetical protein ACIRBX_13435, partial [Kitasatospora sp. NPDC096147]|uniref:hypothetical protein n=1 Tax=Kitasatospora sp. NPDC096147 TaxID=3364093 RepID=UPI0037F3D638
MAADLVGFGWWWWSAPAMCRRAVVWRVAGEGCCPVLHSPSVAWLPGQLPLGVGDFSCSWLLVTTRPAGCRRAV